MLDSGEEERWKFQARVGVEPYALSVREEELSVGRHSQGIVRDVGNIPCEGRVGRAGVAMEVEGVTAAISGVAGAVTMVETKEALDDIGISGPWLSQSSNSDHHT